MYMEELARYLRQQAGEDLPEDTPIDGDIVDMDDVGVRIEQIN